MYGKVPSSGEAKYIVSQYAISPNTDKTSGFFKKH